jgi:hypothetical protein
MSEVVYSNDSGSSPTPSPNPSRRSIKELRCSLAATLIVRETPAVIKHLLRLIEDPLGPSGNWGELSARYSITSDEISKKIGTIEKNV